MAELLENSELIFLILNENMIQTSNKSVFEIKMMFGKSTQLIEKSQT